MVGGLRVTVHGWVCVRGEPACAEGSACASVGLACACVGSAYVHV